MLRCHLCFACQLHFVRHLTSLSFMLRMSAALRASFASLSLKHPFWTSKRLLIKKHSLTFCNYGFAKLLFRVESGYQKEMMLSIMFTIPCLTLGSEAYSPLTINY